MIFHTVLGFVLFAGDASVAPCEPATMGKTAGCGDERGLDDSAGSDDRAAGFGDPCERDGVTVNAAATGGSGGTWRSA
jgi:hypothetical protein